MWYVATYQQVALFSLRQSLSTSSGGKTLLVPTPFALKMALLDVAIRTLGKEQAALLFPYIRDLRIAVLLPEQLDEQWTVLTTYQQTFLAHGTIQLLDDCGPVLSFERADVTSGVRLVVGKDRVQNSIVLPCQQMRYSRGFTLFQRINTEEMQ